MAKQAGAGRSPERASGDASRKGKRPSEGPQRDEGPCCLQCGTPVRVTWRVPSVCKECGAAFDVRPTWTHTVALVIATAVAVVAMLLGRIALAQLQLNSVGLYVIAGLAMGAASFNLAEVVLFRTGVVRLTNVNAPGDGPHVALSPTDEDALAKAEEAVRSKNYAGRTRSERKADAQQLRQSLRMAKALRTGVDPAEPTEEAEVPAGETAGAAEGDGAAGYAGSVRGEPANARGSMAQTERMAHGAAGSSKTPARMPAAAPGRCRFRRVEATSGAAVRRMTAFGVTMQPGVEYYLVFPPQDAAGQAPSGESRPVQPIGYVALSPQPDGMMVIDGFYLMPEERGRGYARSMMLLVAQRAHKTECSHAIAEVSRNNYQAMLVCESLGFVPVGERDGNTVYDLEL